MSFYEKLETRSEDGTILCIGGKWQEELATNKRGRRVGMFLGTVLMAIAVLGAYALAFVAIRSMRNPPPLLFDDISNPYNLGLLIAGILVLAGVLFFTVKTFVHIFMPFPKRSVLFFRVGTIATPQGTPDYRRVKSLSIPHFKVKSIEIGPDYKQWNWVKRVNIITLAGDTITIAARLHPEEARLVTVGLSQALDELRLSIARTDRSNEHVGATHAPLSGEISGARQID
ncbi:hypothetical protein [Phreatobacter stygius]|uniref:DUF304 domain-containing protein n=1 Tax=Phreatobacter stygius TaxID=1940610 RepID=A0A4D7ARG1_9HYPH|nr:hypothetical protein [Phreatobacter stygius]QCI63954.1 hypothetical protein E8M01_06655 [Phreatobacter stygius]